MQVVAVGKIQKYRFTECSLSTWRYKQFKLIKHLLMQSHIKTWIFGFIDYQGLACHFRYCCSVGITEKHYSFDIWASVLKVLILWYLIKYKVK